MPNRIDDILLNNDNVYYGNITRVEFEREPFVELTHKMEKFLGHRLKDGIIFDGDTMCAPDIENDTGVCMYTPYNVHPMQFLPVEFLDMVREKTSRIIALEFIPETTFTAAAIDIHELDDFTS